MSPERSVRKQALIGYVVEELERFKGGEVDRLLSSRELAARFGYAIDPRGNSKVTDILREKIPLLYRERKILLRPQRERVELPHPSPELAWVLGAMCVAGHADPQSRVGQCSFATIEVDFAERFRFLASQVFKLDLQTKQRSSKKGGNTEYWVVISKKDVQEFFGPISRTSWPDTIRQSHQWLLSQETYLKEFLAGCFDARGLVELPRTKWKSGGEIKLDTSYPNVAFFLSDILVRLGFERISSARKGKKISGIRIQNYPEIIRFAQVVHSSIPKKEERLEFYRNFEPQITRSKPQSEEGVINDYLIARGITMREKGKLPGREDLNKLRRKKIIRFSDAVIANHFGGGNFSAGRLRIESILRERQGLLYEELPTPRPTSYKDEDLLQEYKKLRNKIVQEFGRLPSRNDILRLRRLGETIYGVDAYTNHFGGGSFITARARLEAMIENS